LEYLLQSGLEPKGGGSFLFSTQKTTFEVSTTKSAELMETFDDLYQNVFKSYPLREPIASSKIVDEVVNDDLIRVVLGL